MVIPERVFSPQRRRERGGNYAELWNGFLRPLGYAREPRGWLGAPFLRRLAACGLLLLGIGAAVAEEVVEKSMFLVVEDDRIIASNVQTGQFFDFDFSAKEKVQQQIVANGVAIVVTNQRYAGIGVFSGGWQSIRRIAGESVISAEAQDYSALVVTSDRVLAFNGKTGSWSDRKR
jgi:hypothetical protein